MDEGLPDVLVDVAWLLEQLNAPGLRIVECGVELHPAEPDAGVPYHPLPTRTAFEAAHIQGAVFADLVNDLSRVDTAVPFMLPPADDFARAMSLIGVGDRTRTVIYSRGSAMWSTRLWWMLHVMGFDDAAVLDGGFDAWLAVEGPLESGPARPPGASFTARPRPDLMVDQAYVRRSLDDPAVLLINTLRPADFRGAEPSRYGRPGRIPGSVNLPWPDLVGDDGRFVPLAEAWRQLEAVGTGSAEEIVGYCGGGISATMALFHLHRLGHRNLKLYDASLAEWAGRTDLPIECG